MLFPAEQAFMGRDEKRAPLKTPAWEASRPMDKLCFSELLRCYRTRLKLVSITFPTTPKLLLKQFLCNL